MFTLLADGGINKLNGYYYMKLINLFESSDLIDTPAFKAWFKDSKIVDSDGRPLRVYHGTSSDFSKFSRSDGGNMWGSGYYLTTSSDDASGYATGTVGNRIAPEGNAGPNVMPLYASIQNPFDMSVTASNDTITAIERSLGQSLSDYRWNGMKNRDIRQVLFLQFTDQEGANRILQKAGFDGIIEHTPTAGKGMTIMAFKSNQIKSAIGNSGEYGSGGDITENRNI